MAQILAALDEGGANTVLTEAIASVPALSKSGSGSLGPFTASYTVHGHFTGGSIDLVAPATVRIEHLRCVWQMALSFGIDLDDFLPHFCLPQVCVHIPCVGRVCTPKICLSWPTIGVTVPFGDDVEASADFGLDVALIGGQWKVQIVVQNLSQLQFGPGTAGILALIGAAITPPLLVIPFIGPFLAGAVDLILAAIGIAGLTGFLGPILSPFLSGLKIPVYAQDKHFKLLPADGPFDPDVFVELDAVDARIEHSDEDELVLTVGISP
ncbi:MAG TPA: hypothetical protein VGC30_15865 [Dokdonella sp.]